MNLDGRAGLANDDLEYRLGRICKVTPDADAIEEQSSATGDGGDAPVVIGLDQRFEGSALDQQACGPDGTQSAGQR